jgi:hypothetical protein
MQLTDCYARIVSVANLTRQDGEAFMRVAASMPIRVSTHEHRSFNLTVSQKSLDPSTVSTEPRCMVATCRNRDQMPPDVDA